MSGKSSLKTTSLGLITLSKALSQATSHSGLVSSLSWKIVMDLGLKSHPKERRMFTRFITCNVCNG